MSGYWEDADLILIRIPPARHEAFHRLVDLMRDPAFIDIDGGLQGRLRRWAKRHIIDPPTIVLLKRRVGQQKFDDVTMIANWISNIAGGTWEKRIAAPFVGLHPRFTDLARKPKHEVRHRKPPDAAAPYQQAAGLFAADQENEE